MKITKFIIFGALFALLFSVVGCVQPSPSEDSDFDDEEKVDDWVYAPAEIDITESFGTGGGVTTYSAPAAPMDMAMESAKIGFSTGGAMDVNNFRENIENDYLPIVTDITYEGLFYDYYFDTGQKEECEKLFCPSYSYAVSEDPFSKEEDYYLSIGLNSGIEESDFERKKLNLVVVLDISGSMGSGFDSYYYDRFGNEVFSDDEDGGKSKMEIASEAVVGLMDHLKPSDRFGMVLFDDYSYLGKPLNYIGKTDMEEIRGHVLDLEAMNGTYMEAGMEMGTDLFDEFGDVDQSEYENRIIFLTDAMPNIGETDDDDLLDMVEDNAEDGIYTTFIGIGVDFNTELVDAITKVRGANYYSVHSSKEFMVRMDDEFDFMVTPLVFDLELKLDAEGYDIEKVYGSPEADEATGEIMHVNTLFPSKSVEGETKGGLVLLKLKKTSQDASLTLSVSYEDRNGVEDSDIAEIEFGDEGEDYYENTGIRKGILLARYADLMKNWIIDEREAYEDDDWDGDDDGWPRRIQPSITYEIGIICPPPFPPFYELNEWERQSMDLVVSDHYKDLFDKFIDYFAEEMDEIGDESLEKELEILYELI